MLTLQFSSGCPYLCEFCDIPNLYGRQPRFKTAAQVTAELDAMRRQKGHPPVVYFVDDNFVGNRKAAKDMLPHLVAWQKQHGYPMSFACEATLNIAKQQETLALMRESSFLGIFVGIETPEADALKAMRKNQNVAVPMMESIKTLNDYGLEVTSGIILGLDTDSDDTEARLKDFIEISHIPMLTINLLQALPKTPLWDRLKVAGRLSDDPTLESNVRFLRPYDDVVSMWRRCIAYANDPERLFQRFHHQVECHLCEPDDHARARQAHLGKPFGRVGAGVPRHAAHRHPVGLPQAVLARRAPRVAPRPDRCRARHGLHRASPHPVHARGAARRAERVVLFDQIAHRPSPRIRPNWRRRCASRRNRAHPNFGSSVVDHSARVVDVLERHGHDLRGAVDRHMAEELQALARRRVGCGRRLHEDALRSERVVERVLREAPGVDRARHEFPERLEILEHAPCPDRSSAPPCSARRRSARACCGCPPA